MDAYKDLCEVARELPDEELRVVLLIAKRIRGGLDTYGTLDLAHSLVEALSDKDPTRFAIVDECMRVAQVLLEKNAAYGNSATQPLRIMSKASPEEQILVRIDDKLSRLKSGDTRFVNGADEDTVLDLIGYLILLRVVRRSK
jgi:hypothetical protein